MSVRKAVSIVVPTLNEADNVQLLVERIDTTFKNSGVSYEIIFVDDHSHDDTQQNVTRLSKKYPIQLHKKIGQRGKAHSLLQGFTETQYDVICMIDADLQYPPEAMLPMFDLINTHDADVVITRREENETSFLRKLSSKVFSFIFTRLLFGFSYDSQSGLKMFKKKVIDKVTLNPTPWSFDLEFIVRALENNFKILSHKIPFSERNSGVAKVKVLEVTYELAKASLALKTSSSRKKTKHAYRRNVEFAKRINAHGAMLLFGLSLISGLIVTNPGTASAQLINLPTPQVVQQLLPVLNNVVGPQQSSQPTASNGTPSQPTQSQTSMQAPSQTMASPSTQQPSSNQSAASAAAQPAQSSTPATMAVAKKLAVNNSGSIPQVLSVSDEKPTYPEYPIVATSNYDQASGNKITAATVVGVTALFVIGTGVGYVIVRKIKGSHE